MEEEIISQEVWESMGISPAAMEEIQSIVGRMPTIEELSTLLAMWESNGKRQGLLSWLKGQRHAVERNEYLYRGSDTEHKDIHEPRVKECLDIAQSLYGGHSAATLAVPAETSFAATGEEIYLVGNVGTDFLDSEYARQYLHIVDHPMKMATEEEDRAYIAMILDALKGNGTLHTIGTVSRGGLFRALLEAALPRQLGFDILTCREIRLDAFLFGEEPGRFIVSLPESEDDFFLQKMDEARVNCCFLGRTTKGRILVDGMDFGPSSDYCPATFENS